MSNQTLKSINPLSILAADMQMEIDDIGTHLDVLEKSGMDCNKLQKIIAYRQKTIEDRNHLIEERTEIIDRISRIDDELYRKVLTSRYVDGMSCEKLAEELGYSSRGIAKVIKRAHAAFEAIPQCSL